MVAFEVVLRPMRPILMGAMVVVALELVIGLVLEWYLSLEFRGDHVVVYIHSLWLNESGRVSFRDMIVVHGSRAAVQCSSGRGDAVADPFPLVI